MNVISSIEQLRPFLSELKTATEVGFDVETSGLDVRTCKLYTIQVYLNEKIFILDCFNLSKQALYRTLKSIYEKTIVGHNIKYDIEVIYCNFGIMPRHVHDTMVTEVICYNGIEGSRYPSLSDLVFKYTGKLLDKSVRESLYKNGELSYLTQEQLIYAAEDVQHLLLIKQDQMKRIEETDQMKVYDLEMDLNIVVASVELNGIKLDISKWNNLTNKALEKANELKKDLLNTLVSRVKTLKEFNNLLEVCKLIRIPVKTKKLTTELESITNPDFFDRYLLENININSNVQIKELLFLFGYNIESTNADELLKHEKDDEIIKKIIDYRQQIKKVSTYGDNFINAIHPVTGRIHVDFNQVGAATGRMSCSGGINLQNIPREEEYRSCFVAEEGYKYICVDYSAQELRIAGAITKEPLFINAFIDGVDLHKLTATLIFNKPAEEVTKEERQIAKSFNFAVLYGSTEYGLSYNFGLPIEECVVLLGNFYKGYSTLGRMKEKYENIALRKKVAVTLLGRKRFFPEKLFFEGAPKNASKEEKKYSNRIRRESFNTAVQGTSADVSKTAACFVYFRNPFGDKLKIVNIVHDEIDCEVHESVVEEAKKFISDCMLEAEQRFLGKIPAAVEAVVSDCWAH